MRKGIEVIVISFIDYFSEFETMINPKVYRPPPKYSFRNLKKYMPQIKEMAKKEGVRKVDLEKNKEEDGEKKPANKANIILNALKG